MGGFVVPVSGLKGSSRRQGDGFAGVCRGGG
jgi:hypothetical protein